MATITKPMALDESFNTTETNPRSIADVLAGIEGALAQGMGRHANEVSYDNTTSGLSADDVQEAVDELAAEKVDKVTGKGLSANDYTDEEKSKLAGIEAGAQVNPTIDSELSDSSTNAVQNKVVKDALDGKADNADVAGTQSVSGNPITLTDASETYAQSLVVELEPKQDLHGQSAPYVGGVGKNKMPSGEQKTETRGNLTVTCDGNGHYTVNGTTGSNSEYVTFSCEEFTILDAENATLYLMNSATNSRVYFRFYNSGVMVDNFALTPTNRKVSYTTMKGATCKTFMIYVFANTTVNNLTLSPMICDNANETDFIPYSNICHISGYEGIEVEDVGKNLFDKSNVQNGALDSSGNVYLSPSDTRRVSDYIEIEPNTVYYLSNAIDLANGRTGFWYDENKTAISQITFPSTVQKSGSITSPNNAKYAIICVPSDTLDTAQLEKGSTATSYEPYHSSNATIQFGQTVMGGKVNVTDGRTDDAMDVIDLGDLSWTRSTSYANPFFFANIPDRKTGGEYDYNPVSSAYRFDPINKTAVTFGNTGENGTFAFQGENAQVFIRNDAYTDANTFKTAMTGQKICFEKATHNTIATQPTDLKLLKGTNNITTNGTTINLGYQPDNVIGEVKGEIEQHLEMPWVKVIIEGEHDDFDEILLEDGGNIIQFPLADNEIYRHRFLLVEVYTTLLGLPMSLCGNAMLSTQTLIEFEHGAYIPLSIGNLTDGITARVYVGITADNEIQVQLESTASSPLTNIYIRARLVD